MKLRRSFHTSLACLTELKAFLFPHASNTGYPLQVHFSDSRTYSPQTSSYLSWILLLPFFETEYPCSILPSNTYPSSTYLRIPTYCHQFRSVPAHMLSLLS